MYKLILVDDKPNVVEGIRRFGDWVNYGVEVVGVAGNGKEALQLIQHFKPDIAVTDIAMPLMDGLVFTEEALKINPRLKIIILSGYDQFEYAQKAIQLGVMEYLLKPVKIDQIVEAVQKACQRIHSEQDTFQELDNLRLQQQSQERQQQLAGFLEHPASWTEQFARLTPNQLQNLGLLTGEAGYQVIVFQPASLAKTAPEQFFPMLMESGFMLTLNNHGVSMIGKEQVEAVKHKLLELNPLATIVISRVYHKLNDLTLAFQEALNALPLSFFDTTPNQVISVGNLVTSLNQPAYPNRLEREILVVVRAGANGQLEKLIEQFYKELCNNTILPSYVRAASLELLAVTARTLNENGFSLEPAGSFAGLIENCPYLSQLKVIMLDILSEYANQVEIQRSGKNKSPVDRAIEFIQTNLHRDISLDDVAAYTNFTAGYLAHIFKKATGQTVLEFISQHKMQRAAEMVCNPDAKITAVAQLLGYSDRRYFSELFRRHFGCTPSEYRERFLAGVRENAEKIS
jgi:two-component system response regulator YesN